MRGDGAGGTGGDPRSGQTDMGATDRRLLALIPYLRRSAASVLFQLSFNR